MAAGHQNHYLKTSSQNLKPVDGPLISGIRRIARFDSYLAGFNRPGQIKTKLVGTISFDWKSDAAIGRKSTDIHQSTVLVAEKVNHCAC
jgi:hypothetical protein